MRNNVVTLNAAMKATIGDLNKLSSSDFAPLIRSISGGSGGGSALADGGNRGGGSSITINGINMPQIDYNAATTQLVSKLMPPLRDKIDSRLQSLQGAYSSAVVSQGLGGIA